MSPQIGSERRSKCPLNVSVEILGDRWSLLVIRDLMFKGAHSFKDFMDGGEGIATNILADRLDQLVTQGMIRKVRMAADGRKYVYRLTEKGIDLAPVLLEMIVWGARYEKTDAPAAVIREIESRRKEFLLRIRKEWEGDRRPPDSGDIG